MHLVDPDVNDGIKTEIEFLTAGIDVIGGCLPPNNGLRIV